MNCTHFKFDPRKIFSYLLLVTALLSTAVAGPTIDLEVDARELPRRLLHARVEIPAKPGAMKLWYPKWIPGTHAPCGPIQNIAGIRMETPDGKHVDWKRDDAEVYAFDCAVPENTDRLIVKLDYITNQPSVNSTGVDCLGNSFIGAINWNTCLLYPDGLTDLEIEVRSKLRLPDGWKYGTSLTPEKEADGFIFFQPKTLKALIDSPLICGSNFRTIELGSIPDYGKFFLHLASESDGALQLSDDLIQRYKRLVEESKALYGSAHTPEYHFLVLCSDEAPSMGLEHLASSLNAVREREFIDDKFKNSYGRAYLLPHEFMHSWCGKYRRPAGMCTPNFQAPLRTELLWVYEGMAQYLGEVLMVRCGLTSPEDYLQQMAMKVDGLMRRGGRQWRSLEDTAVASWTLRQHSANWRHLRRDQDYYDEGLLFWLEADAIIRKDSDGKKSLNDFCRNFFGGVNSPASDPSGVSPFETDDIIKGLSDLAKTDWAKLIHDRIQTTQDSMALDVIERCGYRLQYSTKPSKFLEERERDRKFISMMDSLGLTFGEDGQISDIVPGMIGEKAGLAPGIQVAGVNERKFSRERIKDAVAESATKRKIDLLVLTGDRYRNVTLDYADGPKYLELVHDETKPDLLKEILKPLVKVEEKK